MKYFRKVFWSLWILSIVLLIVILRSSKTLDAIIFLVVFVLSGINMYILENYRVSINKIQTMIEGLNIEGIEMGLEKIRKQQSLFLMKNFKLEQELDNYKSGQEKKYRDVVKKVLNIDNTYNKKFKLIGETVVKISKDLKKD